MTTAKKLGLDDLEVGQRFTSAPVAVTTADVKRFAAEYDPQPFHVDEAAAADTFFGGLAASGWHTAALTMRALCDGGLPLEGGIIGSGGELSWMKPVRPGDTLMVESEIVAIEPSRSKPDRAAVTVRIVTRNQRGEPVQSFTPKLLVLRAQE